MTRFTPLVRCIGEGKSHHNVLYSHYTALKLRWPDTLIKYSTPEILKFLYVKGHDSSRLTSRVLDLCILALHFYDRVVWKRREKARVVTMNYYSVRLYFKASQASLE